MKGVKNYAELKSDLTINSDNHIGIKKEHAINFLDSITSSYMELYRDVRERVSFKTVRKTAKKKRKSGKEKNTRPITMVVYNVNIPITPVTDEE